MWSEPSENESGVTLRVAMRRVRRGGDVHLVVDAADRPGTIAKIFRQIADAGVNIDVTYSLVSSRVAIGSKDIAKLKQALNVQSPATTRT